MSGNSDIQSPNDVSITGQEKSLLAVPNDFNIAEQVNSLLPIASEVQDLICHDVSIKTNESSFSAKPNDTKAALQCRDASVEAKEDSISPVSIDVKGLKHHDVKQSARNGDRRQVSNHRATQSARSRDRKEVSNHRAMQSARNGDRKEVSNHRVTQSARNGDRKEVSNHRAMQSARNGDRKEVSNHSATQSARNRDWRQVPNHSATQSAQNGDRRQVSNPSDTQCKQNGDQREISNHDTYLLLEAEDVQHKCSVPENAEDTSSSLVSRWKNMCNIQEGAKRAEWPQELSDKVQEKNYLSPALNVGQTVSRKLNVRQNISETGNMLNSLPIQVQTSAECHLDRKMYMSYQTDKLHGYSGPRTSKNKADKGTRERMTSLAPKEHLKKRTPKSQSDKVAVIRTCNRQGGFVQSKGDFKNTIVAGREGKTVSQEPCSRTKTTGKWYTVRRRQVPISPPESTESLHSKIIQQNATIANSTSKESLSPKHLQPQTTVTRPATKENMSSKFVYHQTTFIHSTSRFSPIDPQQQVTVTHSVSNESFNPMDQQQHATVTQSLSIESFNSMDPQKQATLTQSISKESFNSMDPQKQATITQSISKESFNTMHPQQQTTITQSVSKESFNSMVQQQQATITQSVFKERLNSKYFQQQPSFKSSKTTRTLKSVQQKIESGKSSSWKIKKHGRQNHNRQNLQRADQDEYNSEHMKPTTPRCLLHKQLEPKSKSQNTRASDKVTTHQNLNQGHKRSKPRITSCYVRVHKKIKDIASLRSIIETRVNLKSINITCTNIKNTETSTSCLMIFPSKSLALKVKKLLQKDSSNFTPIIDFNGTNFDHEKFQQNRLEKKRRHQQNILQDIEAQSEKLLRNHGDRLKDIDEELFEAEQNMRDFNEETEAIKEILYLVEKQLELEKQIKGYVHRYQNLQTKLAALLDKQEKEYVQRFQDHKNKMAALVENQVELEKQKNEYVHRMQHHKAKLATVVENETFDNDIKILQKQVGIECCRLQKPLPIYAKRQEIVNLVQNNQVSIILGETGSGKSTQMVQYLLEAGFSENGVIVCTQPRKMAAISLATQVAKELATNVGREVGYKVGTKSRCTNNTKIVFMTDHCLLNDCLKDPSFTKFSCIVVDEAQERSLHTDLLLGMIKRCLPQRPELRVVITSATIDPQVFVEFFQHSCACPVMKVSGRTFPVEVIWQDKENEEGVIEDFVNEAVSKAIEIHTAEPEGDILVFLTSPFETENSCNLFQEKMKDAKGDFKCFPLHGQLLPAEQQKVFEPLGRHMRKIVFATNCAETSITIDGIKYVVDTGMVKEMRYDAKRNMNTLTVTIISKSSAEQRKGQAGRTAPGKCYRLFSENTFSFMDSISQPEILRTHLGSSLLKLAELGIGPDMYDFVQSPSKEAITAALKTLGHLGAMKDGKITEIGQWIAKLPFDPKLGCLTLLGKDNDILYDSIVLASVISAVDGLFYQGTSDEDQKMLDTSKAKFSQVGGDSIMYFEIYKQWQVVPEKEKLRWCLENSINNKVIRNVRETVHETLWILKEEYKIKTGRVYSKEVTLIDMLRKMIFQCFSNNVCHFLGLEYYIAGSLRKQAHIHPSSCLHCLAYFPEWVVYSHLTKTSRDFITEITPVDELWIEEESAKRIGFNLEEIRNITISNVYTKQLGRHAFFSLVGPGYTNLRRYEEMSEKDVIVVEADRELGEVKVFSTGQMDDDLERILEEIVESAISDVKLRDWEQALGTDNSGMRVVLGPGGQVIEVLMPEVTRKVYITKPSPGISKESILEKFQSFGKVTFFKQLEKGNNWGFLIFQTSKQAEYAALKTRYDKTNACELEHRQLGIKRNKPLKARLTWCRRPSRGFGFVEVSKTVMTSCLELKSFYVEEQLVTIKQDRYRDCSLFLQNLTSDMTEEIIKLSLVQALGLKEDDFDAIQKVTMIRERISTTTHFELQNLEWSFKQHIDKQLQNSTASVRLNIPRSHDSIRFQGEVLFRDHMEGLAACKVLHNDFRICNQKVAIVPLITTYITVPEKVQKVFGLDEDSLRDDLEQTGVDVEFKRTSNGSFIICILEADSQTTERARHFLNNVLREESLDCKARPERMCLLTPGGRKFLKSIENDVEAEACILVDNRLEIVSLHGSDEARAILRSKIKKFLEEQKIYDEPEEIILKGSNRPPGLMKALLMRYGEDLLTLVNEANLNNIDINYYRHKLILSGSKESILKAKEIITQLEVELWALSEKKKPKGRVVECVACLCPIQTGQLYRLEICAHPYCQSCLKLQLTVAITTHSFPVRCCQETCEQDIAWPDIKIFIRRGDFNLSALTQASLNTYVMTHPTLLRFCLTPDCPSVYFVSLQKRAKIFDCPECRTRTCTACHAKAHDDVTCAMHMNIDCVFQ